MEIDEKSPLPSREERHAAGSASKTLSGQQKLEDCLEELEASVKWVGQSS